MRWLSLLSAALSVCSLAAFGQTAGTVADGPKSALDKATLEQYVRHLFAWGPQIAVKISDPKPSSLPGFKEMTILATAGQASQEDTFLVANDGRKIIRGTVYDVAVNPFDADAAKLKTDQQPAFGPPEAPVSIVMYSDFQCSFCLEEAKTIRQNIPASYPKDVRVYFKDFPLEAIHPWAKSAAIAGRCVFRQNKEAFWKYHDWIFENQAQITPENLKDKAVEFGKTNGLEPIQLAACIDDRATEAEVNSSIAEGRAVGINSTPTMFINGRRAVGQMPWPQIKQIIDHEIEYAKAHGGGEKCCEVTLPSAVKP